MKDYIATIVKNEQIADNVYAVTFDLGETAKVRCGQFGNISVGGTHLLRRPIAICKAEGNFVTFCYQVKGEGTQILAAMEKGMTTQVLMPLGNGFFVEEKEKKVALVGGGVGIFPLISVLREYAATKEISAYIGYRNKDAVCGVDEFAKAQKFVAVTDDGVGFDTNAPIDEKKHVGLRNIRGRLKAMVGGDLILESKPGAGTRAVIMIPKEVTV